MSSPVPHGPCRAVAALLAVCAAPTARADTPAQTRQAIQAACDRAAAGDARRDLAAIMAIYAPSFVVRGVNGSAHNFRQTQAGFANVCARDDFQVIAHCTVGPVVLSGAVARTTLYWHYVTRISGKGSRPAYTISRDDGEQSAWKKSGGVWRETRAQVTRDALVYQR